MMMLKEWGEIQQLYRACARRPFTAIFATAKAACYWDIWATIGLFVLANSLAVFGQGVFEDSPTHFYVSLSLVLLTVGLFTSQLETALANAFQEEYAVHGLAQLPFWRTWEKRRHLHYALFLHELIDRGYSRDTVEKLRGFAVIAGKPEPGYRLLQHPTIVPILTICTVLSIESIKQSALWQRTSYWWLYFVGLVVLVYFVRSIYSGL
jgi:hypothetical protein